MGFNTLGHDGTISPGGDINGGINGGNMALDDLPLGDQQL